MGHAVPVLLLALLVPSGADFDKVRERYEAHLREHPEHFPRLVDHAWEVVGEDDFSYNCMAHAVGDHTRPLLRDAVYVEEFDELFASQGYAPVPGLDFSLRPGYGKIVLYGLECDGYVCDLNRLARIPYRVPPIVLDPKRVPDPSALFLPLHAVLQEPDGGFTSKMGRAGPLIRIRDPGALTGPEYGEPLRVYERRKGNGA